MKDFLKALGLVLLGLGIFAGGGVLWYFYPSAMKIFFMVLAGGSIITLMTCLTMMMLHVTRKWED